MVNVFNPEVVLSGIPLSNNTIASRITYMAYDVKSILIQDRRYSKFSLTVDEDTYSYHSVLLGLARYIKDSRICEELLFMKTLINATGEQVCNAVTEFLETNEISIDNMISICTDGVPSIIGNMKGFVSRLIGDRSVSTIGDRSVSTIGDRSVSTIGDRSVSTIRDRSVSTIGDRSVSTIGDRSVFTIGDRSVSTIHCSLRRENFV